MSEKALAALRELESLALAGKDLMGIRDTITEAPPEPKTAPVGPPAKPPKDPKAPPEVDDSIAAGHQLSGMPDTYPVVGAGFGSGVVDERRLTKIAVTAGIIVVGLVIGYALGGLK